MAQIIWNNVAAPNLGESNSLFAQAIQSLKDAGAGLKDTAKDYQTVVRNRNHGILQDYINSAKTPEELQSEAFNTGFKNLQATLANEYDAVKVNEYRDTRGDVLTKRAGDAVALDLNKLNLTSGTRKENTALGMAELQGLVDNPIAYAAKKAELTQKGFFDGKAEQDFQLGVYNIKNAKRADDFGNATYDANVENALKAPFATQQTIDASKASVLNQAGMLAVAQKNAESERIRANAARSEGSGKFNFGTSPQGLIAKTEESIRNFEATMQGDKAKAMGDNTANAKTWYDEQVANGDLADGVPKTLYLLTQGKYGDKNKLKGWEDLTPSQKYTALSNAQTRSGLGAEWNVTDKDFEQLKTTLQNEVSGMLQGDVDKRNAYAFAQIDNLLGEAYYRDPTVSKEIVFNTLNIDKNLKSAYLKHKQEQAATAEATNNVAQAGAKPASVIVPTVKKPQVTLGESLNGGSAWFQPK